MDVFTSTNTDQVKLEDLVGEGKKYKTADDLAKAYVHSDKFIEQLKTEKSEVLKDLETRTAVEDAIKKIQATNANGNTGTQTVNQSTQTQTSDNKAALTIEDLDKLLDQKERGKTKAINLQAVNESIVKYAGTPEKGKEFLTAKARELNVSVDKLREIGEESPVALLRILGVDEKKSTTPITPMNKATNVVNISETKTLDLEAPMSKADYDELRRTKPGLYFSPAVQNKLMKDRMAELKKTRT